MIHTLKTDPEVYDAVNCRKKLFEIRKDDRGYAVGDTLVLCKTVHTGEEMTNGAPLIYTGDEICSLVTYIMRGPIYGLKEGWVIMGIERAGYFG